MVVFCLVLLFLLLLSVIQSFSQYRGCGCSCSCGRGKASRCVPCVFLREVHFIRFITEFPKQAQAVLYVVDSSRSQSDIISEVLS